MFRAKAPIFPKNDDKQKSPRCGLFDCMEIQMTLRDKTVLLLEKNKGNFVSGQEIAKAAGVSRSAVAKCINSLKNDGYDIKSVNNLGHCLDSKSDVLSASGILAFLNDDTDTEIEVFDTIDSTNSEAKRKCIEPFHNDKIIAANRQSAGRGRSGKSFYSPDKSGVYFSIILHPDVSLSDATGITSAAAVAVADILTEATKKDPKIKWVNDIFIDDKKVCGILTEAISDFESGRVEAVIIGIGINLTTDNFPSEIKEIAGAVGSSLNRNELIAKIYKRVKSLCENLSEKRFMNDYRKYSSVIGRTVRFTRNGVDFTAKAENINDNGELIVTLENGETEILNSGEISIKL